MFSPMQKAHGPEAMPSCPRCPPAPRSTWSGHMVQVTWSAAQYDIDDIEV